MKMQVIKRDGRKVEFEAKSIIEAVKKAAVADGWDDISANNMAKRVTQKVTQDLEAESKPVVEIEHIQDVVESVLMEKHQSVAKAYILYRNKKAKLRRVQAGGGVSLVQEYLSSSDWRIRENSNMEFSLQGLNNYIASDISAEFWLNSVYTEDIRNAHISGDIHIHDLSQISVYCVGWDLQDFLKTGFTGVKGKVSSKPPKHFRTALGQLVNLMFTLQGEAAGAQAVSSFDTLLAPFIAYDDLNYKQVKQSIQEFIFNMNVPTRVGFQSPFSNITLDMVCPSTLKDVPVVIGGIDQDTTYGMYQKEMDMLNKAFCEVMTEGDASGRVFSFPIPTVNLHKNFDWDSKRFDPIWTMTAKYGVPYFANFINSDLSPDDARSMCPLHPEEKIIVKSAHGVSVQKIVDVYNNVARKGSNYMVKRGDKWVKAAPVRTKTAGCVKITLVNGVSVVMDLRHEQPYIRATGEPVELGVAEGLTEGMYLPFNLSSDATERLMGDGYFAGLAVGAFIGDGSYNSGSLVFSLNAEKKAPLCESLKTFFEGLGQKTVVTDSDRNTRFLRVMGRGSAPEAWMRQFVKDKGAYNKRISNYAFNGSKEFLRGILDGWYASDGGNRGRIYTVNEGLREDFAVLCNLLGYGYNINDCDERKEGRYNNDAKVYTLKFHNRSSYGNFFFEQEGLHFVRIASIEPLDYDGFVYCMAVESDDHLFDMANGLVTHNCRLRLDNRELRKRGGGLFGANPLTGSIGVVTLNLPRLGYDSKDEQEFFERLEQRMDTAKESLCLKRETLENFTDAGLYPYSRFYLRSVKERFGKYWENHFGTIGNNGGREACLNLLGKDITTPEGSAFMKRMLNFMRDKIAQYQEETGDYFNLEASPAEGTSYRLALLDKRSGRDMIFANGKAEEGKVVYYTNSTQLPVGYTDDVFKALDHQDELQTLYTGGTSMHIFLGEEIQDIETVKQFVKSIAMNYKMPYFTLSPTFSICAEHGYLTGEVKECPKCGNETEVYSRVVGFYRPVSNWNEGKQAEYEDRKEFKL